MTNGPVTRLNELKNLGTLIAAQDWPAAERLLRRLAKAKSPPADVYYNLAKVLEAAGKPAQMAVWLKRAVAARPDYAIAWFELGRVRVHEGALEDAEKAFQRAVDLDGTDADARRNLGRIALRLGHWQTAAACFAGHADQEAVLARYRIAAETGAPLADLRDAMMARQDWRPEVLKTLTRTARGSVPLLLGSAAE